MTDPTRRSPGVESPGSAGAISAAASISRQRTDRDRYSARTAQRYWDRQAERLDDEQQLCRRCRGHER